MQYFLFSISFTFTSMVVGIGFNSLIKKCKFYDEISNFELIKDDFIYKAIGIEIIKWLVTKTFWKKTNPKLIIKHRLGLDELNALRSEMIYTEISHLIGFVIVILVCGFLLFNKKIELAVVLTITNVFFNLYPALLQQRNKYKASRLINTLQRRL